MSVICVLNFSGNVGKSTITNELLRPRLLNHKFWSIESINSDGSPEAEKYKADKFNDVYEEILLDHDNSVLDIGASNVEMFIAKMNENAGSHDDFDLFIVPIIPDDKQIDDSLSTIEVLRALGVPKNKIVVIFNRIKDNLSKVADVDIFNDVIAYHKEQKNFTLITDLAIYETEAFSRVKEHGLTVHSIVNSKEDFRALAKNKEIDRAEKYRLIRLHTAKGMSLNVNATLDDVFTILTKNFKI